MSTGDHTANARRDSQGRDNGGESRIRRRQRNGGSIDSIYQSRIPMPSPGNGAQPRAAFTKTNTLKGAFQAAASPPQPQPQQPAASSGNEQKTPPRRVMSRGRRVSTASLMSDVSSPPPGGLSESYQQINDADDLVGYVAPDDVNTSFEQAKRDRTRSLSPSPGPRRREDQYAAPADAEDSDLSFGDISDDSLRENMLRHHRDEVRLKRVTQKESPAFSRAKVGPKAALSFENLRRRDKEEALNDNVEPGFNIPKTWGLRGRVSKEWLNKATRPSEDKYVEEGTLQSADQALENDIDFTARSLQVSDSPPVRNNAPARNDIKNLAIEPATTNRLGEFKTRATHLRRQSDGDPIPNTPVIVYRDAEREKPKLLSKGDPQELLRTLSRRESPSVTSTPEQNPVDNTVNTVNTLRNVKTPVVTGAWIDTPLTERAAEPLQDPSVDINSPSTAAAQNLPRITRLTDIKKPLAEAPKPQEPPKQQPKPESKQEPKSESKPEPEPEPEPKQEPKQGSKLESKSEPKPESKSKPKPKGAPSKTLEKPKLPKSALEAVIEDARSGDHSLVLGENTIDSLQDLLDENSNLLDSEPFIKSESEEEEDGTKDGMTFQADDEVVERLNKKLQSLVRSISATQSGLTSLEKQIAKDANLLISRNTKQLKKSVSDHHHTNAPCDGRNYVALPLPRLWYRHPVTKRIRLSRLSWFVIGFFTWFFAELAMCDYYCHPLYAATCERNCLNPNAPRYPLVIPTMLWRWSHLSVVLKPVWTILVAGFRFITQLLGLWDGFFDGPPGGEWPVGNYYYYRDVPAYQPSFEQFDPNMDMGMMQDEYV
ncbi:hypothetical protein AJ79_00665 [Helicocarpus griseus UAMH5409]|uniref:Uncharacterized protein n=1 Tax=Helicocarpus griseus UAMH5409 TaxID=1447875 RepID=A0A2B7YAB6_9EURO|nr:hypothetical protein AJ79_00665 [Helicocarpus griseus UAMH5409]